ncbi:hypothetical protein O181_006545 [Austropuccinia psidii MF-1]|uniref:Peptidase A2 domain-containing protein n=1 Tax=Austropuccinia psidii MF-1 TaxID=1389203 RepID=A0A9Q3BL77_9BASI|nr:hypothetical protein [Austropuccinia psidii MF-1]
MEDLEKIIVLKYGGTYTSPNFQRVPTEGPMPTNKLIRQFSKEQEEFTKKMIEKSSPPPKQQETQTIEDHKDGNAAPIDQIAEWKNGKPPQISSENEDLQINVGLRQKRKESQSQTQQEDKNETQKYLRKNIPGSYHEGDETEEEIRVLIPTKCKKTKEGKEIDNDNIGIISKGKNQEVQKQDSQKIESKNKVKSTGNTPKLIIEHVMKKILEQKINLTLEEILSMSPTFIDKFQNLTTQEKEVIKPVNMSNIQERLLSLKLQDYDMPRLHYACPLVFLEVFIGRKEYPTMALVDTGSEIDIIPEEIAVKASLTSRKLNMNLRGIGGHTKSLVGISELTKVTIITGEEKEIHLFIAKAAIHTILGRPFLADNNVKLEF